MGRGRFSGRHRTWSSLPAAFGGRRLWGRSSHCEFQAHSQKIRPTRVPPRQHKPSCRTGMPRVRSRVLSKSCDVASRIHIVCSERAPAVAQHVNVPRTYFIYLILPSLFCSSLDEGAFTSQMCNAATPTFIFLVKQIRHSFCFKLFGVLTVDFVSIVFTLFSNQNPHVIMDRNKQEGNKNTDKCEGDKR